MWNRRFIFHVCFSNVILPPVKIPPASLLSRPSSLICGITSKINADLVVISAPNPETFIFPKPTALAVIEPK